MPMLTVASIVPPPFQRDWRSDGFEDPVADHLRVQILAIGLHDDRKFVAPQPERLVARAQMAFQALSDGGYHGIAGRMAQLVVYLLEAIDVDEQKVERPFRLDPARNLLFEQETVPKPRQGIVIRAMGQSLVLGHDAIMPALKFIQQRIEVTRKTVEFRDVGRLRTPGEVPIPRHFPRHVGDILQGIQHVFVEPARKHAGGQDRQPDTAQADGDAGHHVSHQALRVAEDADRSDPVPAAAHDSNLHRIGPDQRIGRGKQRPALFPGMRLPHHRGAGHRAHDLDAARVAGLVDRPHGFLHSSEIAEIHRRLHRVAQRPRRQIEVQVRIFAQQDAPGKGQADGGQRYREQHQPQMPARQHVTNGRQPVADIGAPAHSPPPSTLMRSTRGSIRTCDRDTASRLMRNESSFASNSRQIIAWLRQAGSSSAIVRTASP